MLSPEHMNIITEGNITKKINALGSALSFHYSDQISGTDLGSTYKKVKDLPIISATVRPLENLPLGSPLPKSIPYHGKLA